MIWDHEQREVEMSGRALIGAWLVLSTTGAVSAEEVDNGIYYPAFKGEGRRMPRHDGERGDVILGRLAAEEFDSATIASIANDNSFFRVDVRVAHSYSAIRGFTLCVAGLVMPAWGGHTDTEDARFTRFHAQLAGLENAKRVAMALNATLGLREHPGHRYVVSWTPSKPSYRPGEDVMLKMEIRNVGEVPFCFQDGGMDRGPRNNQFSFVAHRWHGSGKAIPDTGDPDNHGGRAGPVTLKPGESFAKDVKLTDWFKFTEADSYRITGMYRMGIRESDTVLEPIWDDFVVGECLVHIEKN